MVKVFSMSIIAFRVDIESHFVDVNVEKVNRFEDKSNSQKCVLGSGCGETTLHLRAML